MSESVDDPECPACHEPVPAGAEYCPYCATSLPATDPDDRELADSQPASEPIGDDRDEALEAAAEELENVANIAENISEYQQVHWSDESDEWSTPPGLLRPLDRSVDGFDLDPASGAEERSIAEETYTEADDGLAQRWFGSVWCNPPYSDVSDWIEKARHESHRDAVEVVLVLVPARTSTEWFHRFATDATALCFIEGRLSFGDADNSAPFPSMLLAFGTVSEELYSTLSSRGVVFVDGEKYSPTRQVSLEGAVSADGGDRLE